MKKKIALFGCLFILSACASESTTFVTYYKSIIESKTLILSTTSLKVDSENAEVIAYDKKNNIYVSELQNNEYQTMEFVYCKDNVQTYDNQNIDPVETTCDSTKLHQQFLHAVIVYEEKIASLEDVYEFGANDFEHGSYEVDEDTVINTYDESIDIIKGDLLVTIKGNNKKLKMPVVES